MGSRGIIIAAYLSGVGIMPAVPPGSRIVQKDVSWLVGLAVIIEIVA
jgi:hypothetical protein